MDKANSLDIYPISVYVRSDHYDFKHLFHSPVCVCFVFHVKHYRFESCFVMQEVGTQRAGNAESRQRREPATQRVDTISLMRSKIRVISRQMTEGTA